MSSNKVPSQRFIDADEAIKLTRSTLLKNATASPDNVRKNIYLEHPAVSKMTKEDAKAERRKRNIRVQLIRGVVKVPNPVLTFEQASFPEHMTKQLMKRFIVPTPIQSQVWPIIFSGYDVIGVSQPGTGKTLAFMLPCFIHVASQNYHGAKSSPNALVLVPSRELALQIKQSCLCFLGELPLRVWVFPQELRNYKINVLSKKVNVDILISTVHCLFEMIQSHDVDISHVSYLVLDDLVRSFFREELQKIIEMVPSNRQLIMMGSAWSIIKTKCWLSRFIGDSSLVVSVNEVSSAVDSVSQSFYLVQSDKEKEDICCALLSNHSKKSNIVFANCMESTLSLAKAVQMKGKNIFPAIIHSGLAKSDRAIILEKFRTGQYNCLISTSLISMGVDVDKVFQVINYDCPKSFHGYMIRIGRTARAGRKGIAMTLINLSDVDVCQDFFLHIFGAIRNEYVPQWLGDLIKLANERRNQCKGLKVESKSVTPSDLASPTKSSNTISLRNDEEDVLSSHTVESPMR